jgi:hypothetical protein
MRPADDVRRAKALVEAGVPVLRAARELGIPRSTVKTWKERGFDAVLEGPMRRAQSSACDAVERAQRDPSAYAYLFGQYLGDGSIQYGKNGVAKLRVFGFSGYPGIIGRVVATTRAIVPGRVSAYKSKRARLVIVTTYWQHLPCLFPQHGPGRKHERSIELTDWQDEIVVAHPKRFLRGLIESDGCRSVNWVNGTNYPRYMFANVSDDIRGLCTRTLDQLGVHWTTANTRNIAVSRRADVAYLDTFIGPKW